MVAKSNADTTQMKKPIISTETLKPLGLPLSTRELSSGDACTGALGVDTSAGDDGAVIGTPSKLNTSNAPKNSGSACCCGVDGHPIYCEFGTTEEQSILYKRENGVVKISVYGGC